MTYETAATQNRHANNTERRPTLHAKPGFSKGPRKPFVPKGHDALLKAIQDDGKTIIVTLFGGGDHIKGKLVGRDKYTLTVEVATNQHVTIYKHAIESFTSVQ